MFSVRHLAVGAPIQFSNFYSGVSNSSILFIAGSLSFLKEGTTSVSLTLKRL